MTNQPKRSRGKRRALKLTLGLLFAVMTYGGAYLSLVNPVQFGRMQGFFVICYLRDPSRPREPLYRPPKWTKLGLFTLEPFFAPAHWLDRRLRPGVWQ